jgi:O-antigen ligase
VTFVLFSGVLLPPLLRQGRRIVVIGIVAGFMVAVTVGLAAWLGSSAIADRLESLTTAETEPSFVGRHDTWKRTIEAVREHAVLGSGLGSFEIVFVAYAGPGSNHVWGQAHNDYLQLLLEAGVVGTLLPLLALGIFLHRTLIPQVRDRTRPDWYLTIGLAMALVSMLLHSLVDFSLQIPAVGFLFVVLAGLLAALAAGRQPGQGRVGAAPGGRPPSPRP